MLQNTSLVRTRFLVILSFLLLVQSCGHIKTADGSCLTCRNNLITGEPANYKAEDHPEHSKKYLSNDGEKRISIARGESPMGIPKTRFYGKSDKQIDELYLSIKEGLDLYDHRSNPEGRFIQYKTMEGYAYILKQTVHYESLPKFTLGVNTDLHLSLDQDKRVNVSLIIQHHSRSKPEHIKNFEDFVYRFLLEAI